MDTDVKNGYGNLIKRIAEDDGVTKVVKFNSVIEKVKREKDKVVITVRGGATYSAKVAVSCLPLGVLKQKTKGIEFDPPLSKQIKKRFG